MSAGVTNQISFKRESTWGTAVVPDKSIPVDFGAGIQTNNDTQFVTPLNARLAKNSSAFIGKRMHEGEYSMDFTPDYPAYFILGALGAVSSVAKSAPNASVYDHTITEQESKPSFTVEQAISDNVRRYAGVLIPSFKISGAAGQTVKISFPCSAKSQATATKIAGAYTTVRPYNWADVDIKIATVSRGQIESFELEYTNGIELLHTLSQSNDPAYNYVKASEVKGKLEMYLDSNTTAYMTDYLAGTQRALQFNLTGDTIGSTANNKVVIDIPQARFTTAETPLREDYNLLTVEFEGIYDTATSKLISAIVTNLLTNLN
jgi:hypothetical protein